MKRLNWKIVLGLGSLVLLVVGLILFWNPETKEVDLSQADRIAPDLIGNTVSGNLPEVNLVDPTSRSESADTGQIPEAIEGQQSSQTVDQPAQLPPVEEETTASSSLPANWDGLSLGAKIRLNPFACNLEAGLEVMWEDGSCHPKLQTPVADPQQPVTIQPATDSKFSITVQGKTCRQLDDDRQVCRFQFRYLNIGSETVTLPDPCHIGDNAVAIDDQNRQFRPDWGACIAVVVPVEPRPVATATPASLCQLAPR